MNTRKILGMPFHDASPIASKRGNLLGGEVILCHPPVSDDGQCHCEPQNDPWQRHLPTVVTVAFLARHAGLFLFKDSPCSAGRLGCLVSKDQCGFWSLPVGKFAVTLKGRTNTQPMLILAEKSRTPEHHQTYVQV